jgi:hypothetical protein
MSLCLPFFPSVRPSVELNLDNERVDDVRHRLDPRLKEIELVVDRNAVNDPARNLPDLE